MKHRNLFDIVIVEKKIQNENCKFIFGEEEIIDDKGEVQTICTVDSLEITTINDVRELIKDIGTPNELKRVLQQEGFSIVVDLVDQDIIKDTLGDMTTNCDSFVDSSLMAFYIVDLLAKSAEVLKIRKCKFRGVTGNIVVWSSELDYEGKNNLEYFIFIFSKESL